MKKKYLEYVLFACVFSSALFSFWSIYRAIKIPNTSVWLLPMLLISLYAIALCLSAIFVRNKIEVELVVLASMVLSLPFVFSVWHFLIVVACSLFMLEGLSHIRGDLDLNVKINLWKTLYTGKFNIIFALALVVSSQYYFTIKKMDGELKIPKLDVSEISTKVAKPILSAVNPGYKNIETENLTVDEYILQNQNSNDLISGLGLDQSGEVLDPEASKSLTPIQQQLVKQQAFDARKQVQQQLLQKNQQLILQEGRAQISKFFGVEVSGNEKMADVVVLPVGSAINKYFQANIGGGNQSSFFPIILALVLFFTIWPIGSLISSIWFLSIILIVKLLLKWEIVKIEKVMVEREYLV